MYQFQKSVLDLETEHSAHLKIELGFFNVVSFGIVKACRVLG